GWNRVRQTRGHRFSASCSNQGRPRQPLQYVPKRSCVFWQKSTEDWRKRLAVNFYNTKDMLHNIRFGFRSLRKNPAFAFVAIAILSLGIGATTAIFSVVNSVLLRPLPFKDPNQLVWIWSRRPDNNKAPFSLPDFLDHRDQNQTLDQIAAFGNIGVSLSGVERTDRLQAQRVSANLFQLLGVDAEHGRLMLPSDDEPGQRHVVVLTHECWQR